MGEWAVAGGRTKQGQELSPIAPRTRLGFGFFRSGLPRARDCFRPMESTAGCAFKSVELLTIGRPSYECVSLFESAEAKGPSRPPPGLVFLMNGQRSVPRHRPPTLPSQDKAKTAPDLLCAPAKQHAEAGKVTKNHLNVVQSQACSPSTLTTQPSSSPSPP